MAQKKLVKVPEFVLFNIVEKAIEFLRKDYASQNNKNNSFLNRVLFGNSIERYELVKQAQQVFINNDESNTRFLETHLMFNMERAGMPTIHITLPGEQTQSGGNGIGSDEGYNPSICQDLELDVDNETILTPAAVIPVYTRRFQSTYNIVITSDNSNEVILIYHTLRALLIGLIPSISLMGLENVAFGGQDVQLRSGMPSQMYMRAISVTCQYETSAPSLFANQIIKDLMATGTMINEEIVING